MHYREAFCWLDGELMMGFLVCLWVTEEICRSGEVVAVVILSAVVP